VPRDSLFGFCSAARVSIWTAARPVQEAQDSPLLFRLTLAATPTEATPDSTSAVLRPTPAQILKPPHRALHRADQVQNVVLVPCRNQLAKQPILLTRLSPHSLRLGRVVPVLPVGPARPLQSLWRARSGARSTVHAASPVRHRRPVTGAAVPTPCSAARGSVCAVEAFAAEQRLGFLGHFGTFPPAVPRPRAPRPTLPATTACPPSFTWTCCTTTVCLPPERRR
jgi:hypothetical protein